MTFHGQSDPKEDYIAAQLFGDYIGTYCEVGAYNGIDLSNTFYFYRRGWRGINFEPHPENYAQLCINQPNAINLEYAASRPELAGNLRLMQTAPGKPIVTGFHLPPWYIDSEVPQGAAGLAALHVSTVTLTEAFDEHGVTELDYLSIDTDSTEMDVLRGLDLSRWRPRLMIIEYNAALAAMSAYLKSYGYRLARDNGLNAFYVQSERDARIVAGAR